MPDAISHLFIVDTSTKGHHLTYLRMISEIFLATDRKIVLVCPNPDGLKSLLATPEFDSIDYIPWERKSSRFVKKIMGSGLFTQWDLHCTIGKWLNERDVARSNVQVFFACFDSFLIYGRLQSWLFSALAPYRYSGIVLGAAYTADTPPAIPRIFNCKQIESVFLLNELVINSWREFGFEKGRWLPDISPVTLPAKLPRLCEEVLTFANGRKTILLFGRITRRKRLGVLIKVLEKSKLDDRLCVIVVGVIRVQSYQRDDAALIEDVMNNGHPAIMIHDTYIEQEEDLNAVINVCDIVFAYYGDFALSSSTLFKTSSLGKPIITGPEGVIGHRMRQHQVGWIVSDDTTDSITVALEAAAKGGGDFDFSSFIRHHNPTLFSDGVRNAFARR